MQAALTEILVEVCGEPGIRDNPNQDLIETGLLDSLALIQLLMRIEDVFGVEIQPTRVAPEIWRHLDSIAALIQANIK